MYASKAVFFGERFQLCRFSHSRASLGAAGSHGPGINAGHWQCCDLAAGSSHDCGAWTQAALFALRTGRAFFDRDLVMRAASVELRDVAGWFPGYCQDRLTGNPSGGCCIQLQAVCIGK